MEANKNKNPKTYFKDYKGNAMFFVTIICKYRKPLLSTITNNEVILTEAGKIVDNIWSNLSDRYPQIEVEKYVLMAEHLHGIINIYQIKEQENI